LRAAFGADRDLIRTISGRGYQFAGEIHVLLPSPEEGTGTGVLQRRPQRVCRRQFWADSKAHPQVVDAFTSLEGARRQPLPRAL
jgi:hypothetical protein